MNSFKQTLQMRLHYLVFWARVSVFCVEVPPLRVDNLFLFVKPQDLENCAKVLHIRSDFVKTFHKKRTNILPVHLIRAVDLQWTVARVVWRNVIYWVAMWVSSSDEKAGILGEKTHLNILENIGSAYEANYFNGEIQIDLMLKLPVH